MSWEELFPIVSDQSYWAVMRYDPRRKDKIQELLCQSYVKYQNDVALGKEIKKQDYKCFVTQRAKEVDKRSICKDGLGGTSIIDVLGFYRRRTEGTEIVQFDEWIAARPRTKDMVEEQISFAIDFKDWLQTLGELERRVLDYLIEGFSVKKISEMIQMAYAKVTELIRNLKNSFLNYFQPNMALT